MPFAGLGYTKGKEFMKFLAIATGLTAAVALAACSPNAQDQSAEAANAIGADVSATTGNAVDDVDAATDEALGSAEATIDNAGADLERGADDAAAATGEALTDAGNSLKN